MRPFLRMSPVLSWAEVNNDRPVEVNAQEAAEAHAAWAAGKNAVQQ